MTSVYALQFALLLILIGWMVFVPARSRLGFVAQVATEIGTGLPAAITGTAVMAWGVIVAVRWWRRPLDPPSLDPLPDPVTPRAGAGECGP